MPRGDKDNNDLFSVKKWLKKSPKVKCMMALYQKTYVTRSKICVESFIIVSQSARNAHFLVLCHSTNILDLYTTYVACLVYIRFTISATIL